MTGRNVTNQMFFIKYYIKELKLQKLKKMLMKSCCCLTFYLMNDLLVQCGKFHFDMLSMIWEILVWVLTNCGRRFKMNLFNCGKHGMTRCVVMCFSNITMLLLVWIDVSCCVSMIVQLLSDRKADDKTAKHEGGLKPFSVFLTFISTIKFSLFWRLATDSIHSGCETNPAECENE